MYSWRHISHARGGVASKEMRIRAGAPKGTRQSNSIGHSGGKPLHSQYAKNKRERNIANKDGKLDIGSW